MGPISLERPGAAHHLQASAEISHGARLGEGGECVELLPKVNEVKESHLLLVSIDPCYNYIVGNGAFFHGPD